MSVGSPAIHYPVMCDRIVELLSPSLQEPGSLLVDGTLGLGGHSHALLEANPNAQLIGIDRDPAAHAVAAKRLAPFEERVQQVEAVFDELAQVLAELGQDRVGAVLLDLGLSSMQIDHTDRGFAYREDSPLDMRMGAGSQTAADVVNNYPEPELVRILRRFGEEKFAERIARALVAARKEAPFSSSKRLVEVIQGAIPAAARHTGGHPAKRTFQALRIEVNDELAVLERVLPTAVAALKLNGRMAVLSYHSLEDRLVKRAFAAETTDQVPRQVPVVPEHLLAKLRPLTRGAERPTSEEITANPRAASARLRAVERIRESS